MIHLGDITKIHGYDAPVVSVVIGGSPCQDLSQAGKRAGFDGIGGFPLIWGELGGETLWASEIEEFPIAVTKRRFGAG